MSSATQIQTADLAVVVWLHREAARHTVKSHAVQATKKRRRSAEPVDESLDWLQTDLLALPEQAGRDQLTEEDRRRLLLCILDDDDLEAGMLDSARHSLQHAQHHCCALGR